MIDYSRLQSAYETAKADLLAERTPDGHWVGELSTSALSTATAVSALAIAQKHRGTSRFDSLISGGIAWLVAHQNDDGGFGDTDKSYSNIATTMLVVAAIHLAGRAEPHKALLERAENYIDSKGRLNGLRERYGADKTFAVPIMTNLALAGLVEWKEVSPLPFELACVPQSWYRFMRMPVVSYAIPALVAIGQCRYFHKKPWNPVSLLLRSLSISRSLKVLRQMQPESGGYLEAVPLTSFVVMSLAATGRQDHAVTREGIKFIVDSVRPDGSWPIDTNLATWVTTLSINALASGGEDVAALLGPQCLDWLLSCQHLKRHPFTGADPGGWGWSDLSGAVPDADDTPGALLAIGEWFGSSSCKDEQRRRILSAAVEGLRWLLKIQNSDGGWPTFCRGWGKLPFDRSGTDLTAHASRALEKWNEINDLHQTEPPPSFETWEDCILEAVANGSGYLHRQQQPDGTWLPLWFGNQCHSRESNPIYGTSKALALQMRYKHLVFWKQRNWFIEQQNADGGWGSGIWNNAQQAELISSVEETALALEVMISRYLPIADHRKYQASLDRGLDWLVTAVEQGNHRNAAPIGFYFAKLWYYEKLYPLAFTVSALGRAVRTLAPA